MFYSPPPSIPKEKGGSARICKFCKSICSRKRKYRESKRKQKGWGLAEYSQIPTPKTLVEDTINEQKGWVSAKEQGITIIKASVYAKRWQEKGWVLARISQIPTLFFNFQQ